MKKSRRRVKQANKWRTTLAFALSYTELRFGIHPLQRLQVQLIEGSSDLEMLSNITYVLFVTFLNLLS